MVISSEMPLNVSKKADFFGKPDGKHTPEFRIKPEMWHLCFIQSFASFSQVDNMLLINKKETNS